MKKKTKKRSKRISKRTKKADKKIFLIPLRYILLLCLMFTTPLIYKIFTPLTAYPLLGLLKLVFNKVILYQNIIMINSRTPILLVGPCIAGSAYLLLLILNLSVPMSIRKRVYSILVSFLILLALNIFRIFFLSILYDGGFVFFDFTHKLFWYLLSTLFVVGIWFFIVKTFSIKEIPVYSDLKVLAEGMKGKKRKR